MIKIPEGTYNPNEIIDPQYNGGISMFDRTVLGRRVNLPHEAEDDFVEHYIKVSELNPAPTVRPKENIESVVATCIGKIKRLRILISNDDNGDELLSFAELLSEHSSAQKFEYSLEKIIGDTVLDMPTKPRLTTILAMTPNFTCHMYVSKTNNMYCDMTLALNFLAKGGTFVSIMDSPQCIDYPLISSMIYILSWFFDVYIDDSIHIIATGFRKSTKSTKIAHKMLSISDYMEETNGCALLPVSVYDDEFICALKCLTPISS